MTSNERISEKDLGKRFRIDKKSHIFHIWRGIPVTLLKIIETRPKRAEVLYEKFVKTDVVSMKLEFYLDDLIPEGE